MSISNESGRIELHHGGALHEAVEGARQRVVAILDGAPKAEDYLKEHPFVPRKRDILKSQGQKRRTHHKVTGINFSNEVAGWEGVFAAEVTPMMGTAVLLGDSESEQHLFTKAEVLYREGFEFPEYDRPMTLAEEMGAKAMGNFRAEHANRFDYDVHGFEHVAARLLTGDYDSDVGYDRLVNRLGISFEHVPDEYRIYYRHLQSRITPEYTEWVMPRFEGNDVFTANNYPVRKVAEADSLRLEFGITSEDALLYAEDIIEGFEGSSQYAHFIDYNRALSNLNADISQGVFEGFHAGRTAVARLLAFAAGSGDKAQYSRIVELSQRFLGLRAARADSDNWVPGGSDEYIKEKDEVSARALINIAKLGDIDLDDEPLGHVNTWGNVDSIRVSIRQYIELQRHNQAYSHIGNPGRERELTASEFNKLSDGDKLAMFHLLAFDLKVGELEEMVQYLPEQDKSHGLFVLLATKSLAGQEIPGVNLNFTGKDNPEPRQELSPTKRRILDIAGLLIGGEDDDSQGHETFIAEKVVEYRLAIDRLTTSLDRTASLSGSQLREELVELMSEIEHDSALSPAKIAELEGYMLTALEEKLADRRTLIEDPLPENPTS